MNKLLNKIQVNCRTCSLVTPTPAGEWICGRYDAAVPPAAQLFGCDGHILHPDLVSWQLDQDASTEAVAVWLINGAPVKNGLPDDGAHTSKEILRNPEFCAAMPGAVQDVRALFPDARLVG